MSEYAIVAEGLAKRYRIGGPAPRYLTLRDSLATGFGLLGRRGLKRSEFWALKDVSFGVPQGEVLGVIGRNGAGKSTLLKLLARITDPTEGRAVIRGRVGSLLEVGTGFHQELTGRENIFLNGAILGMKRAEIERKFDDIVAFSEVEQFVDTPVKHYSSGMYLRLAFAVAAHLDPEILLVDEVLAVGDAGFQRKCLGKMGEVARQGRTVLLVSHNLDAVTQLCERALLLDGGRLALHDRATACVERYLAMGLSGGGDVTTESDESLPAQFLRVLVGTRAEPSRAVIPASQPVVFRARYEFRRPMPQAYVLFRITTPAAYTIFTTTDSDLDGDLHRERRGTGIFDVRFEIPGCLLAPGDYSFLASIYVPGAGATHLLRLPINFSISSEAETEDWSRRVHGGWIRVPIAWHREDLPESASSEATPELAGAGLSAP